MTAKSFVLLNKMPICPVCVLNGAPAIGGLGRVCEMPNFHHPMAGPEFPRGPYQHSLYQLGFHAQNAHRPETPRCPLCQRLLPLLLSLPLAMPCAHPLACFCIQVTASAERQRHGKRQLAIGRQVPSESGMASAEGAARQVRERSGKRQVAEAWQAPSEVSTASAERERHGKRRGGVAQQAQSGRGRNRC